MKHDFHKKKTALAQKKKLGTSNSRIVVSHSASFLKTFI